MFRANPVVTLFLAVAMLAGPNTLMASKPQKTKRPPPVVTVATATSESISNAIEALGSLKANESVDITAHFAEFIREIHFTSGQRVNKGDVLFVLENAEESALLEEAEFTLKEAQRQLARIKSIAGRGDASQSLLDERQLDFNVAKARLAGITSQLEEHTVSAPFAGLIGLRNISQGAYVAPGDVISTLIDDSTMKLDFSIPSIFLQSLEKDMLLTATTRAFPGQVFNGTVATLDNRIDPISRTVTVRAIVPNKQGVLKPGLLMEVLLQAKPRQAVLIPEEALVPKSRKHFVMVAESHENSTQVVQREVSIGVRLNGKAEILSGLQAGEKVVTHGADKIRPNSTVKIVQDIRQSQAGTN